MLATAAIFEDPILKESDLIKRCQVMADKILDSAFVRDALGERVTA